MRHQSQIWTLIAAILALSGGRAIAQETPKDPAVTTPYLEAVESPSYGTATAADPHYDDASLWPLESGTKSYYSKQVWPKTRTWVWNRPGHTKAYDKPLEPKNWLEDGKPATMPFDENTDFVFPDQPGKWTWVDLGGNKGRTPSRRHLTIGRGYGVTWLNRATGNTWVKSGSSLQLGWLFGGDNHTFYRNDTVGAQNMADHVYCQIGANASLELITPVFGVDDSYHFDSGLTILAEGTTLLPQARSTLGVQEKAGLALLSGSTYEKQGNQVFGIDLIVRGKLMGGLLERPLTKDANLLVSWKGKRRFIGGNAADYRTERQDDTGLIVLPTATVSVYSADPKKARLVIAWNGKPVSNEAAKGPGGPENFAKLKEVKETYVELVLLGKLNLDGVLFNNLAMGGLIVRDPDEIMQMKNITWGNGNAGKPVELLKRWDGKPMSLFGTQDF